MKIALVVDLLLGLLLVVTSRCLLCMADVRVLKLVLLRVHSWKDMNLNQTEQETIYFMSSQSAHQPHLIGQLLSHEPYLGEWFCFAWL